MSTPRPPFRPDRYGEKDAYEPHCDASCDRPRVEPGGRVATVLVYCEAPRLGGATVFPDHAGRALKVAPTAGAALFFAYATGARHALHAGCAVRAGAKRVLSIFLRSAGGPGAVEIDVDGRPASAARPALLRREAPR